MNTKKRLIKVMSLFQGNDTEKLSKILIMAKRLLPESMMFAAFISMAGCLDEFNQPVGVDELVHLFSQQVAIHELCKKHNPKVVYEYIKANEGIFPEHWATICKLMQEDTDESILQGLLLQLIQMNSKCQKNRQYRIIPEELFILAQQLILLKGQNELAQMSKILENYLSVDPSYLLWLSEVNSILGQDTENLNAIYENIKVFEEYQTDLFYLSKIQIADNLGLNRKENFKESLNIGNECLNEIDELKERFEQANKIYQEEKQKINNWKNETTAAIEDYYRRYRQQQAEIQEAIKKAKRKQRIGLLKNIIGTIAVAFFAPMLAPALVGASSGLALTITEGVLNTLGNGLLMKQKPGDMLKNFGISMLTQGVSNYFGNSIEALKNINPSLSFGAKALSTTAISTTLDGGKPIQKFLNAFAGEYFQDVFSVTENSSKMTQALSKTKQISANTLIASLSNKQSLASNFISEGTKVAQGVASNYGHRCAELIYQEPKEQFESKIDQEIRSINKTKTVDDINFENASFEDENLENSLSFFENQKKYTSCKIRNNTDSVVLDFFFSPLQASEPKSIKDEQTLSFQDITASKQIKTHIKLNSANKPPRIFDNKSLNNNMASKQKNNSTELSKSLVPKVRSYIKRSSTDVSAQTNNQKPKQILGLTKSKLKNQNSNSLTPQQEEYRKNWPLLSALYDAQHENYVKIDNTLKIANEVCPLIPENQKEFVTGVVSASVGFGLANGAIKTAKLGKNAGKTFDGLSWLYTKGKSLYSSIKRRDANDFIPEDRIQHEIVTASNVRLSNSSSSYKPNNANAQAALNQKMRALEKAQKTAVKTQELSDGRIRYYTSEVPAKTLGPTRGAAYVTEHNPKTGQIRSWLESYDQGGNINRIHPKMINGQTVHGQHYPLTKSELESIAKKLGGPK